MNTVSYIANSQTALASAELGTAQLQLVLPAFSHDSKAGRKVVTEIS